MAGANIQHEIIQCIGTQAYNKAGFIDFVSHFSKTDLSGYKDLVMKHEMQFEGFLADNNVPICRYNTIDEFEKEMNKTN